MEFNIVEMLHLTLEPIGIFFGNTEAKSELEASPDKRNCVIPFILSAVMIVDIQEKLYEYGFKKRII